MSDALQDSRFRDLEVEALIGLYLRFALAAGFLSAVADRVGLWGPPGAEGVAWGDFSAFVDYTATLVPYVPEASVPALGAAVTGAEVLLGIALILGYRLRWTATASGFLLLLFALSMALWTGFKSALDASVFAASGGAFLLAFVSRQPLSLGARSLGSMKPKGQNGMDESDNRTGAE